jgi:hypothetical protein
MCFSGERRKIRERIFRFSLAHFPSRPIAFHHLFICVLALHVEGSLIFLRLNFFISHFAKSKGIRKKA